MNREPGRAPPPEGRPFPGSLCHGCGHVQYTGSARGSVFLMCRALPQKYLPQPVLRCGARVGVDRPPTG